MAPAVAAVFWAGPVTPISYGPEATFTALDRDVTIQVRDRGHRLLEGDGLVFSVDGETFVTSLRGRFDPGRPLTLTIRAADDRRGGTLRLTDLPDQ